MRQQHLSLLTDIAQWKDKRIFDVLPVPVAILDDNLVFRFGNKAFVQVFGPWEGKHCWEAYHKTNELCKHRSCSRALSKGTAVVSRGEGVSQTGQGIHYTKYSLPLTDPEGKVGSILEICIDNTSVDILRHEYSSLFDIVPCSIVIIDKEFRIIESNRMVRDIWGDLEGRLCYKALKGQDDSCSNCTARRAFVTKQPQYDQHAWITPEGEVCHYQVTAVPIYDDNGDVSAIMEMGMDVTELHFLRDQGELRQIMLSSIVSNSLRGLTIIASDGDIPILNQSLVKLLGLPAIGIGHPQELYDLLPDEVNQKIQSGEDSFYFPETVLFPERGDEAIPVSIQGTRLRIGSNVLGLLLGFHDLREVKKLEKAKVEAERMAAVGHTVSGLAHGVKNLVTALEGGMYMLTSGMNTGKPERIAQGIDMLQRNIDRIGGYVKSFLNFARSRQLKVEVGDPAAVLSEVVELYKVKAQQNNIALTLHVQPGLREVPYDYESLHEALTNLVGNAVDACIMTEEGKKCGIDVRLSEKDDVLIYEIADTGCGMDADTKKKVFSNFFTTKGDGGTGLGLLMTKKQIQEHGGSIELESEVGKGTTFRIRLPRASLPRPGSSL